PYFCVTYRASPSLYTLSLHDALPISGAGRRQRRRYYPVRCRPERTNHQLNQRRVGNREEHYGQRPRSAFALGVDRSNCVVLPHLDRKSTRLNSSHEWISYAVFCLKKK